MTRIVQIGLGGWGKNHTRHLSDIGGLVAVCDVDHEKANSFASQYNVMKYYDTATMLKMCDFDIAVITTPTSTHYEIAKEMIENDKHVFLEKPFTSTVKEGNKLIELAEQNNVKITCGYIERFNPVTDFIKNYQDIPNLLEFHRESAIPVHIKDAGIVLDTMVHDIDTACWLFNSDPIDVMSMSLKRQKGEFEDMAIAVLMFPGDRIATLVTSWNTQSKMRTIHATYENCIIRGDFVKKEIRILDNEKITIPNIKTWDPLKNELECFIANVKHDFPPLVSARQANRVTEIAQQILDVST